MLTESELAMIIAVISLAISAVALIFTNVDIDSSHRKRFFKN